jgi:hypothetical protein
MLTACPCCNTSTGSYRRPLFQPTECLIRPCVMIPCAVLRGAEHVHAISVLLLAFDGLGSCFGQPRPQHETRISAETVAGPGAKGGKRPGSRDRSIAQVDESWALHLFASSLFGASEVMMLANGFKRQSGVVLSQVRCGETR